MVCGKWNRLNRIKHGNRIYIGTFKTSNTPIWICKSFFLLFPRNIFNWNDDGNCFIDRDNCKHRRRYWNEGHWDIQLGSEGFGPSKHNICNEIGLSVNTITFITYVKQCLLNIHRFIVRIDDISWFTIVIHKWAVSVFDIVGLFTMAAAREWLLVALMNSCSTVEH